MILARLLLALSIVRSSHGFCASKAPIIGIKGRALFQPSRPRCIPVHPLSNDDDNASNDEDAPLQSGAAAFHDHVSTDPEHSIWEHRGAFWRLTRPSSLPGILMFHMLGVYLAAGKAEKKYWVFLASQPTLWLTLLLIVMVSSTSMIINDYYDAKLGRDALKLQELNKHKALVDGDISLPLTKRFLTYLYGFSLAATSFLPGVFTRLSVNGGLILTYLYTAHLKPLPLVKNAVCAFLIATAPLTSGSAAVALLGDPGGIWRVRPLWRLSMVLFFGILGREMMMDCNDVIADEAAGIRTIPVVFGRSKAAALALGATAVMSAFVCIPPSIPFWYALHTSQICTAAVLRRFTLGTLAGFVMLRRSWQVFQSKGKDKAIVKRAVDESLITVALIVISFV